MPPKAKISKEMIIEEAFQIVREEGADRITARRISERLKCSTQPVLYHFATVDEIKEATYRRADEYHTGYLMSMDESCQDPMLGIGMNYIRFAMEERNLFQFLFHSNEFSGVGLMDLTQIEDLEPVLQVFQDEAECSEEDVKEIFMTLFIFVHGYASLLVNNEMDYDEQLLEALLTKVYMGAVYAAKEAKDEEGI